MTDQKQYFLPHSCLSSQTNQYPPSASNSLPGHTQPIDSRVLASRPTSLSTGHECRKHRTLCYRRIIWSFSLTFVSLNRSALVGYRASLQTASPVVLSLPTLEQLNLHILLHAQATKLLEVPGLSTTTPAFSGVQFGTDPCSKSRARRVYAPVCGA